MDIKLKDEALEQLKKECALIGLNADYTDMVSRGRIDIDLAKQFQSDDEYRCCEGLGCDECLPW